MLGFGVSVVQGFGTFGWGIMFNTGAVPYISKKQEGCCTEGLRLCLAGFGDQRGLLLFYTGAQQLPIEQGVRV